MKRVSQLHDGKRTDVLGCKAHLQKKDLCPEENIRLGLFEDAFVTLLKKLQFVKEAMLVPYYTALSSRTVSVEKVGEEDLAGIAEKKEKLLELQAKHYINASQYRIQLSKLEAEEELLKKQNGREPTKSEEWNTLSETKKLLVWLERNTVKDEFDGEAFTSFVDKVTLSKKEAVFHMKCGLELKEELS